jgi:hypothetical protein
MEKELGRRGFGRERIRGVDVVTIVLLYIIALDGVRRGIDVTMWAEDTVYKSSRAQAAEHLMLRNGLRRSYSLSYYQSYVSSPIEKSLCSFHPANIITHQYTSPYSPTASSP